ncbi:hemolysin III family protein [Acidiferrobacter sp.]|uniref:PAQR family membrane homeostasis protein TrhA n=1 Tax=Acidiferrobacter sp. TaxID=1872107 RepID=UPI002619C677|nr:hemolysin III family protein [Acidiferrobacter sp.]
MNARSQGPQTIEIGRPGSAKPPWHSPATTPAGTGERPQSRPEERVNAALHALGAVLALAAGLVLGGRATQTGSPLALWCVAVSSAAMIALYVVSAAYHILPAGTAKDRLQRIDRMVIAVFVAGSYTPIALLMVRAPIGDALCAIEWGLTALAVAFLWGDPARYPRRSERLYRVMGWITILAARPFFEHTPPAALVALGLAGACYSAGVALLVRDRVKYLHAGFHLLTLAGGGLQLWAISRVLS